MESVQLIAGRPKDLGGGFLVRRLLPAAARRAVGPFVFFDHFGPMDIEPGMNTDVRPHPHIGLATVTYLFQGAMQHRDSLGFVQRIEPGEINWMTAGRGIVHSERTPEDLRVRRYGLHGLQLWVALPLEAEECDPGFSHTGSEDLPRLARGGVEIQILVGRAFGARSPVKTANEVLYCALSFAPGAEIDLPALAQETAVYAVEGDLEADGTSIAAGTLAVLGARETRLRSAVGARAVLIGGEPLDAPRHLWWNFVSSREGRIQQAADDWKAQRLGQIPGETEFIPLP
jgi:redox-sensitive bicupin YhaK (pirin superfamily)